MAGRSQWDVIMEKQCNPRHPPTPTTSHFSLSFSSQFLFPLCDIFPSHYTPPSDKLFPLCCHPLSHFVASPSVSFCPFCSPQPVSTPPPTDQWSTKPVVFYCFYSPYTSLKPLSLSLSLFYLQFHSPWKHCGANSRGDGARGPSPRHDDPLLSLLSALWTSTAPCSAAADATGSKRPTLHYWWNCRFVRRELFSFSAPTSKSFPDKRCWATQKKKKAELQDFHKQTHVSPVFWFAVVRVLKVHSSPLARPG